MRVDLSAISTPSSRRLFLRRVALAGGALAFPDVIPAAALGADAQVAPSNRVAMGFIGMGRQALYANLPWHLSSRETQVVAVCDVDAWRLEQARQKVEAAYAAQRASGQFRGCAAYRDFREVLARKDVDAVMISTPDHWHAYMAVAAARAGKDIALEKPISLSVAEGRAIVNAVRQHQRVFRTDTEVRSELKFLQLVQVVRNGLLGKVQRVLAGVPKDLAPLAQRPPAMPVPPDLDYDLWQGPAPARPYTEQRVHPVRDASKRPGWMMIRDYSQGMIANWGAHILDIVQWALNTERTGPVEVEGTGVFPQDNLWDVLQDFQVRYRYASGVEVFYSNAGRPFVRVEGAEGWIEHTWFKAEGFIASNEAWLSWKPGPNDISFPLLTEKQDFVNCVKSRRETMIPAEVGHRTTTLCQIGHIAIEVGGKLQWDPEAERFRNSEAANRLLTRPSRAPWQV
ncbi:Gfo/Idh/MocA family oxidoreductase [Fontisphaera persica]|uniref:Gfo/Idh/MocA family protein n=1 Tax=Fontisphaera persica TaxID=2974023 RepID=UPI0024C094B1|nr:Gfo/Idh/MocA family oxidoreductase [Fontisphaera persica]WCJ59594.1 Gfo/Idh/MocA family oxidoreductase [Fontisphaera persica]